MKAGLWLLSVFVENWKPSWFLYSIAAVYAKCDNISLVTITYQ